MEAHLEQIIAELESAIRVVMDPATPHQVRLQAYQTCENFKENSNQCAQCGLRMSCKDRDPITRHFGLQLLEHCVKFQWNKMTIEAKKFLKDSMLNILVEGTLDMLTEQRHIKDALSRIIVEIAKREWPQQWPDMLSELDNICSRGPMQTELILLVFLRLAEDVLIFQSTPNHRRRDIMQGLTNVMSQLFPCFINILESNMEVYRHSVLSGVTTEESRINRFVSSRLCMAAAETITAFMEWVNIAHVIDQDGRLLRLLCSMLSDVDLRLSAVECLLAVTNRKGKLEDRQPLLMLFRSDSVTAILNAAMLALSAELNEQTYVFLKRLCQVLTSLGSQLCALWGNTISSKEVHRPDTMHQYLEALLAFTDHDSQTLCAYTQTLWSSFLKHEHISKDPILNSFIPQLVSSAAKILIKTGFPSHNNSPRCQYSQFDFDSDEDFVVFFTRLRSDCAEMLRCATAISPKMAFHYIVNRIEEQLKKPIDLGEGCVSEYCNLSSPSYIEWDALTVFLENVMARFPMPPKDSPLCTEGIQLLRNVLSDETMDPMILSALLSAMSALFPFITHLPNLLPLVLTKMFSAAVFNIHGQTKATRSRAVKNVRRHACSILVKISKLYPNLLLPGFEALCRHIQLISTDPDGLSQMEKCTLMEALILINNQNKNHAKQLRFLSELIEPIKSMWLSNNISEAFLSVDNFIKFVGLDQMPVEPSANDVCGIKRSQLVYCVISILAILKRSQCPEVSEEAAAGGFMSTTDSGVHYICNPAAPVLKGLLDNVLRLCRTLNELYLPENLMKRHPGFSKAYDLMEFEKMAYLGIQPPLIDNTNNFTLKQPLDRMQSFMTLIHDNCFHILGNSGPTFGYEFYRMPNLANSLLNSCCLNLEALPEYRLRTFIRAFLKPYIFWCPKEFYQSAVLPIVERVGKHFHERLIARWEVINQKCEERNSDEEDNSESQEIFDEFIVRNLTREYLDFLNVVFREKKGSLEVSDEMATDDMEIPKKQAKEEKIGDLGLLILQNNAIFPSMVHTIFTALCWNDTSACHKANIWCVPIIKQLMVPPVQIKSEDAKYLLWAVIMGLNMHGQHEATQYILLATALQIYELLISDFNTITEVMLQIPSCSARGLQKFTEMICSSSNQAQRLSDKKKKDMFRALVEDAIGKNIGQQFKKEVVIRSLAPFQTYRPKAFPLDVTETRDIGLCTLFQNDCSDI